MAGFISLDNAKQHLRLDGNEQDDEVRGLIDAAASFISSNFGVVPKGSVTFTLDAFTPTFRIPARPIDGASVRISYLDTAGEDRLIENCRHFERDGWTWIQPAFGQHWPVAAAMQGAVKIDADGGYDPSEAPEDICHASRLLIGHWFTSRSGEEVPPAVAQLLDHYRFRRV